MKCILASLTTFILCASASAQKERPRPRITGIAAVQFYSTNITKALSFYTRVMSGEGTPSDACLWCEKSSVGGKKPVITFPFSVQLSSGQNLVLATAPKTPPSNLLYEIVFATDDVKAMKKYLAAKNIPILKMKGSRDEYFAVMDPEGHRIAFKRKTNSPTPPSSSKMRIIHAGFVVRDRDAEDRFYKDILGFHVYWHGGMKDDETNWVDMQVPDGTDWIEYMLNVSPDADHHTLGVMNHFAIGVSDIEAANFAVRKKGAEVREEPKIGRDGKWQLNLYDPDDTRVELMEFTPTQKPCCSEYTGPHPKP
jgi:catechol 2,3-dioxygenase-like lactoylglutathione lyase family enzyme